MEKEEEIELRIEASGISKTLAAIITASVLVMVLAGVAGTFYGDGNTPNTNTTTTTTAAKSAETTLTLIAENIKFNTTNPTFTVPVSQPVQIHVVNKDTVPHNFIIEGVPGASTNLLNSGDSQTITVTFDKTGTYKYYCSVHPGLMDGQIQVINP